MSGLMFVKSTEQV